MLSVITAYLFGTFFSLERHFWFCIDGKNIFVSSG